MSRAGPVGRAGSFSRDPGTSEKYTNNQVCDYMEKSQFGLPGGDIDFSMQSRSPAGTAQLAGPAISNHIIPL